MIVYVSVGNADGDLSSFDWIELVRAIDDTLASTEVLGRWFAPVDTWQSGCWCIQFDYDTKVITGDGETTTLGRELHWRLGGVARRFGRPSISWAHTPLIEDIRPPFQVTNDKGDSWQADVQAQAGRATQPGPDRPARWFNIGDKHVADGEPD